MLEKYVSLLKYYFNMSYKKWTLIRSRCAILNAMQKYLIY